MIHQIFTLLGFLYFTFPLVSAIEYSWEPINIQNTVIFIISLTLGYTALQINEILKSCFGEYLTEDDHFPDAPEEGQDFDDSMDDFLSSAHFLQPKTAVETLVQATQRPSFEKWWLIPENAPPREHRQGAVKRLLATLTNLFSSLTLVRKYAVQNEELTNALNRERDENRANMKPLLDLVAEDQVMGHSPTQIAYAITSFIHSECNKLLLAFPSHLVDKEKMFSRPAELADLVKTLKDLRNTTARMTTRMSLDPTPGINLAAFWTDIPEAVRGNSPMPTSEEDARAFLRSLTNVHSNPTQCTHPIELASIFDNPQQNWQDSLEQAEQLFHQPAPAPTGIPVFMENNARTPEQGLFKSTEVPSLTKKSNYWTWRSATRRFLEGVTVRNDQVHFALTRIVGRFEGEVTERASNWDLRTISHLPWTQAYALFFAELDRMFLPPDYYNKELAKFYSCKPSPGQTAQDFLGSFQTRVQTLNAVANVQNEPPLDGREIARQLLRIIPSNIRGILQMHEEHVNALSLDRLIHRLTTLWNNAPSTLTGSSHPQNKNTTSRAATPSEATNSFGTCNKPCWGTSPEVPQDKRGLARPGGILRPELKDVCLKCRRGKSAHNGTKIGCELPGNHTRHNAPSAKQEPEQGKVEEIE